MSSQQSQTSHVGPKATGGMAGAASTPANAHLGATEQKPKAFDSDGAIGKQFTGMFCLLPLPSSTSSLLFSFPPFPVSSLPLPFSFPFSLPSSSCLFPFSLQRKCC